MATALSYKLNKAYFIASSCIRARLLLLGFKQSESNTPNGEVEHDLIKEEMESLYKQTAPVKKKLLFLNTQSSIMNRAPLGHRQIDTMLPPPPLPPPRPVHISAPPPPSHPRQRRPHQWANTQLFHSHILKQL